MMLLVVVPMTSVALAGCSGGADSGRGRTASPTITTPPTTTVPPIKTTVLSTTTTVSPTSTNRPPTSTSVPPITTTGPVCLTPGWDYVLTGGTHTFDNVTVPNFMCYKDCPGTELALYSTSTSTEPIGAPWPAAVDSPIVGALYDLGEPGGAPCIYEGPLSSG